MAQTTPMTPIVFLEQELERLVASPPGRGLSFIRDAVTAAAGGNWKSSLAAVGEATKADTQAWGNFRSKFFWARQWAHGTAPGGSDGSLDEAWVSFISKGKATYDPEIAKQQEPTPRGVPKDGKGRRHSLAVEYDGERRPSKDKSESGTSNHGLPASSQSDLKNAVDQMDGGKPDASSDA